MRALAYKTTTRWIAAIAIPLMIILGTLILAGVTTKAHSQDLDLLTYFKKPVAVAVDSDGYVFVADAETHRVLKFTNDGNMIRGWGGKGSGDGQFNIPNGIAIDSSDNVYVTDGKNNRVQKFSNKGEYLDQWGNYCEIQTNTNCVDPDGLDGPLSKGDGEFYYPRGISLDKLNTVYVVDSANSRIQKFTTDGKFVGKWGGLGSGNGQFKFPTDITIDSLGYAYVADYGNHRIQKFIATFGLNTGAVAHGVYMSKWGAWGSEPNNFKYPVGIDRDPSNYLYITDSDNNRVKKINSNDGSLIRQWPVPFFIPGGGGVSNPGGTGDGQFNKPYGIALNPSGTNVYVADSGNDRIQKFTNTGGFVTKWGPMHKLINIPFE